MDSLTDARDEDAATWWNVWREQDYSWDGLAEKGLSPGSSKSKNLQDWWLLDGKGRPRSAMDLEAAGELVRDPNGKLWHIAHVPFEWDENVPSVKSTWGSNDWIKLHELFTNRLNRSTSTDATREGIVQGLDGRAQFEGCVLDRLPTRTSEDGALHAVFDHAFFSDVRSKGQILGAGTSFRNCLFAGVAGFRACLARGPITFENSIFVGPALFDAAKFEDEVSFHGAPFRSGASFVGATFVCWAFFDHCSFNGADFPQSKFLANASFHGSSFNAAEFGDVVFERQASFGRCDFSEASDVSFWNSTFRGDASFVQVFWPAAPSTHSIIFRNAHFQSMADFGTENFHQFAAFAGARFDGMLFLDRTSVFSDRCFNRAIELILTDAEEQRLQAHVEVRLRQVEGGLRNTKLAFERQRDRAMEARLHQLELTCKRMQESTPTWERVVSWLYGTTALYGNSAGRPALALILLWLVSAFGYFVWYATLTATWTWHAFIDSARMSAAAIFRPFDSWARATGANDSMQAQFLDGLGPLQSLVARLALSFESLLALMLLFLVALALRRRFQIS